MKQPKNILFVDDDHIEHIKIKKVFSSLFPNVNLNKYTNPKHAIEWLQDNKHELPSLMILDLNMPEMNGFEVLDILKQDFHLKKLPVVVFTTSRNPKDIHKSYDKQVSGYFVKPHKIDEYKSLIQTISNYWTLSEQV